LEVGDLAYVARICRMVQGTPLGILLAAAWLEALSPGEIAQEISRSLDFLESQMHDLPERQRSLRAVFEYSWNLLADEERALFAQLAVFRGGFTREAVQQITGTNLRTLTVMVNKSLLRRDNVSGRYEIHELLRQYAEEKLRAWSGFETLSDAHSQYYTGLVAELAPKLNGHGK
jgi:predicted ATPase